MAACGRNAATPVVEADKVDLAKEILAYAKEKGVKFLLPVDSVETQDAFPFQNNLPLLFKQKGNAARGPQIPAAFGKGAAHIGGRPVAIIRQGAHNHRNPVGPVTLIGYALIINGV